MFVRLAVKSLVERRGSVCLTLLAMTVSIFVFIGVEHIRNQAKASFTNTVSGVDLIVGARTGSLNLLLYSVFRIGSPTNSIDWQSYEAISSSSKVAWAVPISLGDSHKGFRVMGTTRDYFEFFSYGQKYKLSFLQGTAFSDVFDIVLGADVATKLNYNIGDELALAHGVVSTSFSIHDDRPFRVSGILAPTGTPIDQTLHVSLQGIEAVHRAWLPGGRHNSESKEKLMPQSITALMLGLKSRMTTFQMQREINGFSGEPLLAILPGVALSELWLVMGLLEKVLRLISLLVFAAALLGLSAMLLASIKEREREIQLLRAIGAPASFLFLLVELEALLISLASVVISCSILYFCLKIAGGTITSQFGLAISANILYESIIFQLLIVILLTMIAAAIPSMSVYNRAKKFRACR